jgi:hypothetical protein
MPGAVWPDLERENYTQPIDDEIVESVAKEFDIAPLHFKEVLQRCDDLWDPHRDLLIYTLGTYMEQMEFAINSIQTDDALVIGGSDLTPCYVVSRVEYGYMIDDTAMNPVELGIAVEVAHKNQAEELGWGELIRPLVVSISPED